MLSASLNKTFSLSPYIQHFGKSIGGIIHLAVTVHLVEGRKEMFYFTMHSTHFYLRLYMVKDDSAREETCCCHMGNSFQLAARVLLYGSSHKLDNTYMGFVTPVVEHWLECEITQWVHVFS